MVDAPGPCPDQPFGIMALILPAATLFFSNCLQRELPHSTLSLLLKSVPHLRRLFGGWGSYATIREAIQVPELTIRLFQASVVTIRQFNCSICPSLFLSLTTVFPTSIPQGSPAGQSLPWSLFSREPSLRQLLSSNAFSTPSHHANESFPSPSLTLYVSLLTVLCPNKPGQFLFSSLANSLSFL